MSARSRAGSRAVLRAGRALRTGGADEEFLSSARRQHASATISRMELVRGAGLASSEEKRLVGGRAAGALGREQQNNPGGRRRQGCGAGAEWRASQAAPGRAASAGVQAGVRQLAGRAGQARGDGLSALGDRGRMGAGVADGGQGPLGGAGAGWAALIGRLGLLVEGQATARARWSGRRRSADGGL